MEISLYVNKKSQIKTDNEVIPIELKWDSFKIKDLRVYLDRVTGTFWFA